MALHATMISRDGVTFIWYAQNLAGDPAGEMRRQAQHPLYPGLILGAHKGLQSAGGLFRPPGGSVAAVLDDPVRSWTLAAVAVALLGGLAVVAGVYALAALLFDRRVALLSALLTAFAAEFCQLSGDALSDMPHLALYLFGFCAAVKGIRMTACLAGVAPAQATGRPEPRPSESGRRARGSAPLPHGRDSRGDRYTFSSCKSDDASRATGMEPEPNRRWAAAWLWLAGVLSGLAFLMRPEGGEVAVLAVTGALVLARQWSIGRRLLGCAAVCVGFALAAGPYMSITGKIMQKKSLPGVDVIWRLFVTPASTDAIFPVPAKDAADGAAAIFPPATHLPHREERPRLSAASSQFPVPGAQSSEGPWNITTSAVAGGLDAVPRALLLLSEHWSRALRFTLTPPAILWLILRRRRPAENSALRMAAGGLALHVAVLLALIFQFSYWDMFAVRHTLILAGLTLPFAAAGILAVVSLVPASRRLLVEGLIVAGLIGPTVPWMIASLNTESLYLRRAGEWIRAQPPDHSRIHTTRFRVAFYGQGVWQWSPTDDDAGRILADARAGRPDWLVFDEKRSQRHRPAFFEELRQQLLPGETLELAHVERQEAKRAEQRALVYRYRPPP